MSTTPGQSPDAALSPPPSSALTASKWKTKEDYLLSYQDRMLPVVDDSCKSVNRLLAISYGMALLVALVFWQGLNELSVFGLKLPLNPHQIPVIVPLLLLGTSFLLSHELLHNSDLTKPCIPVESLQQQRRILMCRMD